MPEMIENRMLVDSEWDESEYGIPSKRRLERMREAYEEEEYGFDKEND